MPQKTADVAPGSISRVPADAGGCGAMWNGAPALSQAKRNRSLSP